MVYLNQRQHAVLYEGGHVCCMLCQLFLSSTRLKVPQLLLSLSWMLCFVMWCSLSFGASHLCGGVSLLPACSPGNFEVDCEAVQVCSAGYAGDVEVLLISVEHSINLAYEVVCTLIRRAVHACGRDLGALLWNSPCAQLPPSCCIQLVQRL